MNPNDYNFNSERNFPSDDNGKSPFNLPENYFSSFENKLRSKLEYEHELDEFPLLASVPKHNLFTVPADYFATVEQSVEYKTELITYPNLQAIEKKVFNVPESYEIQVQSNLFYKYTLIEELHPYVTLYGLDKVNPFVVTENYFVTVSDRIKGRIHQSVLPEESFIDRILDFIFGRRLAFTFGLILITVLSFYFNQPHQIVDQSGGCKTLACLEKQEILNSKSISNFDEEQLIDLVDLNSLNKQLNLNVSQNDSLLTNPSIEEITTNEDILDAL